MAKKDLKRGLLITFEGAEGSGKSTQIKLLADYLTQRNFKVLVLREPGSTTFSEGIRKILLDKKNHFICEKVELLLYLAARAQLVKEKIIPALKEKTIILCDRFQDSTLVYQGYGLGLDKKIISMMGKFATGDIVPDLTFLLDIAAKEGLRRAGGSKDRIQGRSLTYHRRVRNGYLALARKYPKRIKVIQAKDISTTHDEIKKLLEEFLCH